MESKAKSYAEVLTFFIFEALAFTSFTLGGSIILFCLFGFLTMMMLLIFNYEHLKKLDTTYFLIFIIPLVIFAILSSFSKFTLSGQNHISITTSLFVGLASLVFISAGYLSRTVEGFKVSNAMMVIYGGIAILVLLSLGYALVDYKPFYTITYQGQYIYYEGVRFPVWDNIPMLRGFEFIDVSIENFQLFATMLFTSVIALKFVSPKKETKKFIIFLIYAIIGFVSMCYTINITNVITTTLVVLFILFLLFVPKKGKVLMPIMFIVLFIVAIVGTIFFINAQSSWEFAKGLREAIASNALLNKLFNANRVSIAWINGLDGALSAENLFGFASVGHDGMTKCFLFDNIITTGIFGALAFDVFLVFALMNLVKYYKNGKDDDLSKNLLIGFVCVFYIYSLLGFDAQPYAHYDNIVPMQHNAMYLLTLFLIGLSVMGRKKAVENIEPVKEIKVEENIFINESTNEVTSIEDDNLNEEVEDKSEDEIIL